MSSHPRITPNFKAKKENILAALSISPDDYTDKSPKGSVDAPIIDLIDEINAIHGLVTTSSCSGRVAVFVEGPKDAVINQNSSGDSQESQDRGEANIEPIDNGPAEDPVSEAVTSEPGASSKSKALKTGPGGKGGGRWLYVSHDPVSLPGLDDGVLEEEPYTRLCGLVRASVKSCQIADKPAVSASPSSSLSTRLIRLSFSPLILHILAADLTAHARPLLAAAINAGFRESGVQSLTALDPSPQAVAAMTGSMLAIRTAGLTFETVIGRVGTSQDETTGNTAECMEALVSEEYLRLCFQVINDRFKSNEDRKERLRAEITRAFLVEEAREQKKLSVESKEDRRERKRNAGLLRRQEVLNNRKEKNKSRPDSISEDVSADIQLTEGAFELHKVPHEF